MIALLETIEKNKKETKLNITQKRYRKKFSVLINYPLQSSLYYVLQ